MISLIDGDLLPWEFAHLTKKEGDDIPSLEEVEVGEALPFEWVWGMCANRVEEIIKASGGTEFKMFISSPKYKTWRYDVATIQPYKGNRDKKKELPEYFGMILHNLKLHYGAIECEGIEADDALSMTQYADIRRCKEEYGDDYKQHLNTIICSRDKDLKMVPGYHYSWALAKREAQGITFQEEVDGLRCFYKQLIIGDSTDNILGLYGQGPKSAAVGKLSKLTTEREMFNLVHSMYEDRFGNYAKDFMKETGLLLKMQEFEGERWNKYEKLLSDYYYDKLKAEAEKNAE